MKNFLNQYYSMLLGIFVVIVATVVILIFAHQAHSSENNKGVELKTEIPIAHIWRIKDGNVVCYYAQPNIKEGIAMSCVKN